MNGCQDYQKLESVQNASLLTGIVNGKTREIPLTQGRITLVDVEDYGWLNQWKWCALKDNWTFYAARSIYLGNKKYKMSQMHREILSLKKYDKKIVDHINRNGLDNRRVNLRIVTNSLNSYNSKLAYDNRSGYRGVCWNKINNKWTARITINGVVIFLGHYQNIMDAVLAYDHAAVNYWGDDAFLNLRRKENNENIICV